AHRPLPYTTLFRSVHSRAGRDHARAALRRGHAARRRGAADRPSGQRSCHRLLLEELRRVIRRDAAVRELAKDLLAALRLAVGLSLRWKTERADHGVETRPHCRVADTE